MLPQFEVITARCGLRGTAGDATAAHGAADTGTSPAQSCVRPKATRKCFLVPRDTAAPTRRPYNQLRDDEREPHRKNVNAQPRSNHDGMAVANLDGFIAETHCAEFVGAR
mmetsp:Transcript_76277/g.177040  ORF Transcript_76277/g.177040 Transcript_76277/m.177040 type:complete len:110 (+) Transcript_76277:595-924(+)